MRQALQRATGYVLAVLAVGAATVLLKLFRTHINPTTVALALLLVILFVALRFGSRPAVVASIAGVFCFNLFFLPPVGTFAIAEPGNWVALAAFLITAVTTGELSAKANRRAAEAEAGKREIERLYSELRNAFERASEAEALRRSEQLKSALLDAVSHDIRTPLTSIKASVTALLEELRARGGELGTLDAEGRLEMLEVIDEEADRLNRFVEGLIELARIEAGQVALFRRSATLDAVIHTALERAEPLTRRHKVEVSIEPDLPLVCVDAKAIAEVVYTLVDNAAKYSPPGTVITVSAGRCGEHRIQLTVEDDGPGIPAELRERVFDKFFRAARVVRGASPTGIGMGLAIARGIVEAHGGQISIEDGKVKKGARVALTLPFGDEYNSSTWQIHEVKIARSA